MLWYVVKKDGAKTARATLNRKYKFAAMGLVAVIGAVGVMILTNFQTFWINFHKVFFTNDLWLLDPKTDLMIRMLPEGYFMDIAIRIGTLACVFVGLLLLVGAGLSCWGRKKEA